MFDWFMPWNANLFLMAVISLPFIALLVLVDKRRSAKETNARFDRMNETLDKIADRLTGRTMTTEDDSEE